MSKYLATILTIILLFSFSRANLIYGKELNKDNSDNNENYQTLNQLENSLLIYSQKGSIEIGGTIGTPSGLNSRYWITDHLGLDNSLGISSEKDPVFTVDLLYERFELYKLYSWKTLFFAGFGAKIGSEDGELSNNFRIPIGISFPFRYYPLSISIYAAPAFVINPKRKYDINWGIGVRYNFGKAYSIKKKQDILLKNIDILKSNIDTLQHGLASTKGELATTKGKLNSMEHELDIIKVNLDSTKDELITTRGKLNSTKGKLNATKGELDSTKGELNRAKGELDATKGELATTKGRLYKTKEELGSAKIQLLYTKKELDNTKNQLDDVISDLKNTKKILDDKQEDIQSKQDELDKAREIIKNAFTGKEKEEEQRKIALKQDHLDKEIKQLNKEKLAWERIKEKEAKRREQLREECESRGGIINQDGYCTCRTNEEWNSEKDKCICIKGYKRNPKTEKCEPCEIIRYNGRCVEDCAPDEKKVRLKKGPNKFVCIKRCRKRNEVWSKRKKKCVCKDGYYRNKKNRCVPRK
ncbi:MAG: hypothetical protein SVR08_12635 [Spirochaetota bacterium]|nr:hypothetical protein [Spirochaetota bacterium]